jgi:RimJ/RimL family protein N-acetyltransferase
MPMAGSDPSLRDLRIRDVQDGDVDVFFEHELDPEANRMAAFPARQRDAFVAHWAKIRTDETVFKQTILVDSQVAGNIVSWEQAGKRLVGYWVGRDHWGRGVATTALALFLDLVPLRPLYAHVAVHNVGSIRVLERCGFQLLPAQHVESLATVSDDVEELVFIRQT